MSSHVRTLMAASDAAIRASRRRYGRPATSRSAHRRLAQHGASTAAAGPASSASKAGTARTSRCSGMAPTIGAAARFRRPGTGDATMTWTAGRPGGGRRAEAPVQEERPAVSGTVAVRDGVITGIEALTGPGGPAGAGEIAVPDDCVLLPGLVDSHVHVNE